VKQPAYFQAICPASNRPSGRFLLSAGTIGGAKE